MKDKPIPEEELFDQLDTMYERVADIEKEEAAEAPFDGEGASFPTHGTRVSSKKPLKRKTRRDRKRSYRPIILGTIAILFAVILAITFFKPMTIPQLLKMGDSQEPTVIPLPRTPKIPPKATPPPSPTPPTVATPPAPPTPPTTVTAPEPPIPPSESFPVQTKQEAMKDIQQEAEKATSQEIMKLDKPLSQGKYYAIQVGSFRDIKNVHELVEVFKKEGLDAYWISMRNEPEGSLYRVFVGRFVNAHEAAQFSRDKKILRNYPDSFIREVSSSNINR